ncbi:MAG: phage tail assembly chaperone [Pseudomonadota bacterium]
MTWPFADWHRFAVRRLQLQPSEFWAMPLADWLALVEAETGPRSPAMDGAALKTLMEDYPDE